VAYNLHLETCLLYDQYCTLEIVKNADGQAIESPEKTQEKIESGEERNLTKSSNEEVTKFYDLYVLFGVFCLFNTLYNF
jgi:hypothetical protein